MEDRQLEMLTEAVEAIYEHDPHAMTGGAHGGGRRPDYTERALAAIERGRHPFGYALANNGRTGGECVHATIRRRWYKCKRHSTSASAATDLRLKWPACFQFEPAPR